MIYNALLLPLSIDYVHYVTLLKRYKVMKELRILVSNSGKFHDYLESHSSDFKVLFAGSNHSEYVLKMKNDPYNVICALLHTLRPDEFSVISHFSYYSLYIKE